MKLTVALDGQTYEVEVGDVRARPIRARLGEEQFEVWPEAEQDSSFKIHESKSQAPHPPIQNPESAAAPAQSAPRPVPSSTRNARTVIAPLPGVIVSVAVAAGVTVSAGQELCALEAMKMKNIIRATRAGTVSQVLVAVGQTVKHKDVLVEYAE